MLATAPSTSYDGTYKMLGHLTSKKTTAPTPNARKQSVTVHAEKRAVSSDTPSILGLSSMGTPFNASINVKKTFVKKIKIGRNFYVRDKGIEPFTSVWKTDVLPVN